MYNAMSSTMKKLSLTISSKSKRHAKSGNRWSSSDLFERGKSYFKRQASKYPLWVPCYVVCSAGAIMQIINALTKYMNPNTLTMSEIKRDSSPVIPGFTFCYMHSFDSANLERYGMPTNTDPITEFLGPQYPAYWNWNALSGREISNLSELFQGARSKYTVHPYFINRPFFTETHNFEYIYGSCTTWKRNNKAYEASNVMSRPFGFALTAPAKHRQSGMTPEKREQMLSAWKKTTSWKDAEMSDALWMGEYLRKDGWIVFMYDSREIWRSFSNSAQAREHFYINYDESLSIDISMTEYNVLDKPKQRCTENETHSVIQCELECLSRQYAEKFGCYTPLVYPVANYSECKNVSDIKEAFSTAYGSWDVKQDYCSKCFRRCSYRAYTKTTQSMIYRNVAKPDEENIFSTIVIRFPMGKVTVVHEYLSYDINNLVADVGGSVGLFLGFSFIGLATLQFKNLIGFVRSTTGRLLSGLSRKSGDAKGKKELRDQEIRRRFEDRNSGWLA